MDYKIVEGRSQEELTRKVKELIDNGWKPIGGHQVVIVKEQNRFSGKQHMDTINTIEYSQTMTKE